MVEWEHVKTRNASAWRRARHIALRAALCAALAPAPAGAQPRPVAGHWTRGLAGGWGHSWSYGVPGWGKTESEVQFLALHPQLGRFVTGRLELYGEGTLFLYYRPTAEVAGGLAGLGGRYHFWNATRWAPYIVGGAGLFWTALDVPELDRTFNFQLLYGVGLRLLQSRGPDWIVELRNHHVSNAGTAGENLGLNAAAIVAGAQWVLR